jgi:hypothetical protein
MGIGARIGARTGPVIGAEIGFGNSGLWDPLAIVTRDVTSLWYRPANSVEWTALLSVAGITNGNPGSVWSFQEASGNLADGIGSITLNTAGAPAYQQTVIGSSAKAIVTTDGAAVQHVSNTTTAPNPAIVSTLLLAYVVAPTVGPASDRGIMCTAPNHGINIRTSGRPRLTDGTLLANSILGTTQMLAHRTNLTAATFTGFTLLEKAAGTFVAPTNGACVILGSTSVSASASGYLYGALFSGSAAELTDAQVKKLMQTLGGNPIW